MARQYAKTAQEAFDAIMHKWIAEDLARGEQVALPLGDGRTKPTNREIVEQVADDLHERGEVIAFTALRRLLDVCDEDREASVRAVKAHGEAITLALGYRDEMDRYRAALKTIAAQDGTWQAEVARKALEDSCSG